MVESRRPWDTALAGPVIGLAGQMLVLGVLAAIVGLSPAGWAVGLGCGVVMDAALARGLIGDPEQRLGPAGWVTLTRATLAVGVAALTADGIGGETSVAALVTLAAAALALDFVDGQVARRTDTASALGARMDGEVDAFLILVLSVYVAPTYGWWVLLIGAARYAFLTAGWALAWMRAPLPRRDWRKTVAAAQGITLTVAAAGMLPRPLTQTALAVALLLLAESFGRDVVWLWHRRTAHPAPAGLSRALTALALVVVWLALVAPNEPGLVTAGAFLRVPLEGLVVVALAALLPDPARRVLAWVVGGALGVLVLVKILDVGFFTAFDRPFDPVDDWNYASSGVETLRESIGSTSANLVLAAGAALAVAVLVLPVLATLRLTRVAADHRRRSLQAVAAVGLAWALCWAFGMQLVSQAPIASTSAAELAFDEVRAVQTGIQERAQFADELRHDRYAGTPGDRLLTGLRGKDVVLLFVESYGPAALGDPRVDATLDRGAHQLQAAGFSARSGWLTSPTFGGISWLAHSTLHSGVWINRAWKYDQLLESDRFTLSRAFGEAGWRTMDEVPSNNRDWPEGAAFYGFDRIYDRRTVGYRGPTYAYASMPDQFVLLALQRLELGRRERPPLFAEVDLVSSHTPWTQIPPLIAWGDVGDGSIYDRLPVDHTGDTDVTEAYGRSIAYSLSAVYSFIERYGRDDLVLVVLGDHQPATVVTGDDATHDVPISVIAHDPAVLDRISDWGWADGVRPAEGSPVWPMSAFRDRFLGAYGPR